MRDEAFASGHADSADQVVFRARLSGRKPAVTALAILVVVAMATVAMGASRYLPGQTTGSQPSGAGSQSAVTSAQPSLSAEPVSSEPVSKVESAEPASSEPLSTVASAEPSSSPLISWTDATPLPSVPTASVRPPLWLFDIQVSEIDLPAFAVDGGSMNYSIVLTNTGDTPAPLDPCPGYKQSIFDMPDNEVGGGVTYLLNCPAIGPVIAPGHRVRLQMVYWVPAATPVGQQLFFWICDCDAFHAAIKSVLEIRAA
jgi:hypothetical protein